MYDSLLRVDKDEKKNHRKIRDSGMVEPHSPLPLFPAMWCPPCLARMVTVYPPEALLPCLHPFWARSVCGALVQQRENSFSKRVGAGA